MHEAEYNLELDDPAAIAELQAALRRTGACALLTVAERLGIADRLTRPELLTAAAFRLEDPEAVADWSPRFVAAAVVYDVFVPGALVPFLEVRAAGAPGR